jgi:hypothetical protein
MYRQNKRKKAFGYEVINYSMMKEVKNIHNLDGVTYIEKYA